MGASTKMIYHQLSPVLPGSLHSANIHTRIQGLVDRGYSSAVPCMRLK